MDYKESVQKSSELTRMIIHATSKLKIPLTPIAYALFYEYYLGSKEALKADIDPILSSEKEYTSEYGNELFLRHIVSADVAKLEKIEKEMVGVLNNVMTIVKNAGVDAGNFYSTLSETTANLSNGADLSHIKDIIGTLAEQTQEMAQKQNKYGQTLTTTSNEIEELRQELSRVRKEASQDTLTGLANRRAFDEGLLEALETCQTKAQELCLLMVDIDHFKKVNDTYGHIIGDQVIKFVADVLKQSVKGRDLVARFGGEEYCVILQNTPAQGAARLAESIRETVQNSELKQKGTGRTIDSITISIGVESAKKEDVPEALIGRADKALYTSKQTGRNRVTIYGQDT